MKLPKPKPCHVMSQYGPDDLGSEDLELKGLAYYADEIPDGKMFADYSGRVKAVELTQISAKDRWIRMEKREAYRVVLAIIEELDLERDMIFGLSNGMKWSEYESLFHGVRPK